MVNVTQSNFIEQSNDLIQRLPSAAFVAIDEEMTGIVLPKAPRNRKDETPSQRYDALKAVPEKYAIIQLGICLFHEHPNFDAYNSSSSLRGRTSPQFVARKYNFLVFPPADVNITREVVLNPSSISFLNQHNMDFDLWTKNGISFVTSNVAEELLTKYQVKQLEKQEKKKSEESNKTSAVENAHNYNKRRRVELRRTEDIDFFARAMASLREWLDSAQPLQLVRGLHGAEDSPEGLSFLLPPANSFLRRALYESIQAEYPALILENAGPSHPNQIRVLRLNPEEQRTREERLQRESWEELIVNQIGVWRVFMALSLANHGIELPTDTITFAARVEDIDWTRNCTPMETLTRGRKIPIVVHNGYQDLMFLLSHFHSHVLPTDFSDAKNLIHGYFPLIYDTKYLATECAPASLWNDNTALENLFIKVIQDNEDARNLVETAPDVGLLGGNGERAHDAAYDAFMTGSIYIGACRYIVLHEGIRPSRESIQQFANDKVGPLEHLLCPEDDATVEIVYGRNKLYLMQSIYSVDLEDASGDPLCRGMIPDAIFRISNFDPSVTTRTIIQCLSDLYDSRNNRVTFEIIWVDDATFLVAASQKPALRRPRSDAESAILLQHGNLILKALRTRFPREDIRSWREYTAARSATVVVEDNSWSARIGRLLRYVLGLSSSDDPQKKRDNSSVNEDSSPERKRRRII